LTERASAPILSGMTWRALWLQSELVEAVPSLPAPRAEQELRLFPIVGGELCYPVSALLARGQVEEAGQLVPDRAWVASMPLYG
jgi:hypothetical protein